MNGTIFDIQRFSVHDGPGIRTTVFMKGCPLRCRWCHNPEGLSVSQELQFFKEKCIGCGRCGDRASLEAAAKCPTEALAVCGRRISAEDALKEVLKDRIYYGNSGGITFSGGECLLQADFVASVLSLAKAEGIHTAIDTCGCVTWEAIEKTLPFCDLYLYDIKCINPDTHKAFTGVDNSLIIENLKKLSETGKEIWIRTPVIPGFNDTESEMTQIADLLSPLSGIRQITLMPYHTLGASKYETLGLTYPYDTSLRIDEATLASFKRIFESRNIPIA
jgi:pyruvate formate lyase activating enzyme